jgi:hypothetical protein
LCIGDRSEKGNYLPTAKGSEKNTVIKARAEGVLRNMVFMCISLPGFTKNPWKKQSGCVILFMPLP